MSLSQIYRPIQKELEQVEKLLFQAIQDHQNPTALKIAEIVLNSPGKRIRPALLLFCGKAVSKIDPAFDTVADQKLLWMAGAFELIHMASLVHDDVIDQSSLRHNKPTVNSLWGEDASVAFGDYLYSVSSDLTTRCRDLDLHACMTQATRDLCEGELLQVCEKANLDLSEENYLTIIRKKTAGLFASACETGALVYQTSKEIQLSLREFGLLLGTAFQIIDDLLDFVAEEKKLGKTPGQDFEFGKLTLPLLYLLENASEEERREIRALITNSNSEAFVEIKARILQSQAEARTIQTIHTYLNAAREKLSCLPESEYRKSLEDLIDYILERVFSYSPQQK